MKSYGYVSFATVICLAGFSPWAHADELSAHGFGLPGQKSQVNRTVKIEMRDNMRFSPDKIKVKQGDTIRFVISNAGALKHEFVLGTKPSLQSHNAFMQKHEGMDHADPSMVTVMPGQSAEIIWKFTNSARVLFACLQPGHFVAGMQGSVTVVADRYSPHTDNSSAPLTPPDEQHEHMHH